MTLFALVIGSVKLHPMYDRVNSTDREYSAEEAAQHEEISKHARYVNFSAVLPLRATLSKLVACCGREMQQDTQSCTQRQYH